MSSRNPDVSMLDAEDAVRTLLRFIGEQPNRDGLFETPHRVIKALLEMTEGYEVNPRVILDKRFDEKYDQVVILRNIAFTSLCEHHLLPFMGVATVGYLPGLSGEVVGISKLARLVHVYARRLQVQERLTQEIAGSLQRHLDPAGVGVVIKAQHQCMSCRGIRQAGSEMITSCLLGAMRDEHDLRSEFMRLM